MGKRYCSKGHDTWEVGRTVNYRCVTCHREAQRDLARRKRGDRNEYRLRKKAEKLGVPVAMVGENRHALSGDKLRHTRLSLGLTQRELGTRTGLSKGTIKSIEAGRRNPLPQTQKKLLDYLSPILADRRSRWEKVNISYI